MEQQIVDMLQPQLRLVDEKVKKQVHFKKGEVREFVDYNENDFMPAMMLLVFAGVHRKIDKQAIELASVVQFISVATQVHDTVVEEDSQNQSALPVLFGDLLYGNFFMSLCKANSLHYLEPLSKSICSIHEGKILHHKFKEKRMNQEQYVDIAKLQYGQFISQCCQIGAKWSGFTAADVEIIGQFGEAIGTFLFAEKEGYATDLNYLEEAKTILTELNDSTIANLILNLLEEIIPQSSLNGMERKEGLC